VNAESLWPVLVYVVAVLVLVGGMLGLPYMLGERHRQRTTGEPYESGIAPTGSARLRFDVRFYMIAMFFVIFDLETAFLFAWAIAFRELGWLGYVEAVIFVAILLVALVYLWRLGGLDWGPRRRSRK
jgi:NADH-quinone oxidoreductase subunit A